MNPFFLQFFRLWVHLQKTVGQKATIQYFYFLVYTMIDHIFEISVQNTEKRLFVLVTCFHFSIFCEHLYFKVTETVV